MVSITIIELKTFAFYVPTAIVKPIPMLARIKEDAQPTPRE
jgi:hypothetical protein